MICTAECTFFIACEKGFERRFVPDCHWVEHLSSDVVKTGQTHHNSVTVYIPDKHKTLCPINTDKDIVVKGNCDFVFDNTDEESVSKSMRAFRKQYEFFTVKEIGHKSYGNRTSHIKVVAV